MMMILIYDTLIKVLISIPNQLITMGKRDMQIGVSIIKVTKIRILLQLVDIKEKKMESFMFQWLF